MADLSTFSGRKQYRIDMLTEHKKIIDGYLKSQLGESEVKDRVINSLIKKNSERKIE